MLSEVEGESTFFFCFFPPCGGTVFILMKPVKPQNEMTPPEREFWEKYAQSVVRRGIAGRSAEWHIRHAQRFAYSLDGKRLRDVDAGQVDRYLDELGRSDRAVSWQMKQAVSALRVLFCDMTDCVWAADYDWWGKRDAFDDLPPEHPTIARATGSAETVRRRQAVRQTVSDPETLAVLGRLRDLTRVRNMSIRTEQTYSEWSERFATFCGGAIPREPVKVTAYLEHLALVERVAPATQAQALNALVFLYREVMQIDLGDLGNYQRPKARRKLPVVLTPDEVDMLLGVMTGASGLMARMMYGTGMRLSECVRLRVQDIDWGNGYVSVRGKGGKWRRVPLPDAYADELKAHLAERKLQYEKDLAAGFGEVYVKESLRRKLGGSLKDWGWQYVFAAARISTDPRSGRHMRHHASENVPQKAIKRAMRESGLPKQVSCGPLTARGGMRTTPRASSPFPTPRSRGSTGFRSTSSRAPHDGTGRSWTERPGR